MEPAQISKKVLADKRADLEDLLKRRFYIMQSFGIYGGKAGLYDYGPPGCAIKANVEKLWREHFVIEEDMLEISGTNITPDIVLRASGHEEKFSDFMVADSQKPEFCYRADHLIEEHIEEIFQKEKDKITPERKTQLETILKNVGGYKIEQITQTIKDLGIKSPKTGNALGEPYPFNLMFGVQIGPTGDSKGYLRPETAQGIFVNFRNLLEYNGGRVPFACAQLGIGFRNEIAPRAGLLRLREFHMAEIEHFIDPQDKTHPKFENYKNTVIPLYHRARQATEGGQAEEITLGQALSQGIINNQTLAYFIARTYLFLVRCGAKPEGIRFRQHLSTEMAHYSADCWDAEILTSYGWVEVVGIADRSAYDLTRHTQFSKKDLVAARKFTQAKDVQVLEIKLAKPLIGKTMKGDGKAVIEYLETMDEDTKKVAKEALDTTQAYEFTLDGKTFKITPDMITFELKNKKIMEEKFVPNVIEPSFGIGRIIYCCWEHNFKMRSKERTYLHLPPKIAPYKCSILTVVTDDRFEPYVKQLAENFKKLGISNKVDATGQSIGKRYARTDEVGIPFGVTVDHQTLEDQTVTLREIDTTIQIRVKIQEVPELIYNLSEETAKWSDVIQKYPRFTTTAEEK